MSVNFTGFSGGTYDWDGFDFANVATFNELLTAYHERDAVRSVGTARSVQSTDLSAGTQATSLSSVIVNGDSMGGYLLQTFQQFVIDRLTSFVDHTQDLTTAFTSVPMFNSTTFYAAAGMDAGGFRRYNGDDWDGVTAPTFEYGVIQAGDIFGWWIYEDLQRAFTTMKITTRPTAATSPGATVNESITSKTGADWDTAKTNATAAYPETPSTDPNVGRAIKKGTDTGGGAVDPFAQIFTRFETHQYNESGTWGSPAALPYDATVKFYTKTTTGNPGRTPAAQRVYDAQGTSFVEDKFVLTDTLVVPATGTAVSAVKVGYDHTTGGPPPNWNDAPVPVTAPRKSKGFEVSGRITTLQWDFTNSN